MGVLDEAIRNHLELRRRAGASEAELARAEAEALGPARRDPAADIFADEGPAAAAVATTVLDPVQAEESNRAHEHEPPLDTGVDHEAQTAIFDLDQDELAPPPPARPPLREVDSELPVEESVVEGSVVEEQTVEEPPIDREPPVDEVPVEEPPPVEDEPPPAEPPPVEPTPAEDEPPPSPAEPPAAAQPTTEPHAVEPPFTADPHRHPADGD